MRCRAIEAIVYWVSGEGTSMTVTMKPRSTWRRKYFRQKAASAKALGEQQASCVQAITHSTKIFLAPVWSQLL
jgi:hypothetical protein